MEDQNLVNDSLRRTIKDDRGHPHEYVLFLHPAGEGFPLLTDVMAIAGDVLSELKPEAAPAGPDNPDALPAVGTNVGASIRQLAVGIQQKGGQDLMHKLLRHAKRDGKNYSTAPVAPKDSGQWCFNQTFMGNYGELLRAIVFVLEANFGGFLSSLQSEGEKLMGTLAPTPPSESSDS